MGVILSHEWLKINSLAAALSLVCFLATAVHFYITTQLAGGLFVTGVPFVNCRAFSYLITVPPLPMFHPFHQFMTGRWPPLSLLTASKSIRVIIEFLTSSKFQINLFCDLWRRFGRYVTAVRFWKSMAINFKDKCHESERYCWQESFKGTRHSNG